MKYPLFLLLFAYGIHAVGQPIFYGVNGSGNGQFVKYNVATNQTEVLYALDNDGYGSTYASLFKGSEGTWYGTEPRGGNLGYGTLFSIDPNSGQFTRLYNFGKENRNPSPSLIPLPDGRIYGSAMYFDSSGGGGTIYLYDPKFRQVSVEAKIQQEENGLFIQPGLAYDNQNKIYGATFGAGGEPGYLFSFDIPTKQITIIHRFSVANSTVTGSGLMFGPDGKLYGVNSEGGLYFGGEFYSFDPVTKIFEVIHAFSFGSGNNPDGTPTLAPDGKLYGITLDGGALEQGVIYSYDPAIKKFDTVHSFEEGLTRDFNLIVSGDNHFLLTFSNKGLFSFDISSKQYEKWQKVISLGPTAYNSSHAFNTADGIVLIDEANKQWAVTKTLNAPLGVLPTPNILVGLNRMLYGSTVWGGKQNLGVLYAFDPATRSYHVLKDSSLVRNAQMIMGFDQNIYFSTRTYGPISFSTIDKISIKDTTQSTLHKFESYPGAIPGPPEYIMQASDGLIYWLSPYGGKTNPAAIYSYSIGTDRTTKLATIPEGFDFMPILTEGLNKTLYGFATNSTNFDEGLIFSFNITTKAVAIYRYNHPELGRPEDKQPGADRFGNIYTASTFGGKNSIGTIFRLVAQTGQVEKLIDLGEETGFNISNLHAAGDGLIYGLSSSTTNYSEGNLFSIDPITKAFKIIRRFTENDPLFTAFVELPYDAHPEVNIQDVTVYESDGKAKVMVHIDHPTIVPLRLSFKTVAGTATPHGPLKDYTSRVGYVKIRPGTTSGKIRIPIRKDTLKESNETFYVVIRKKGFREDISVVGRDTALVTIRDGNREPKVNSVAPAIIGSKPITIATQESPDLLVSVSPNPSKDAFRVTVSGTTRESIELRITNELGIQLELKRGLRAGQTMLIGRSYLPGTYFLTARSGSSVSTLTLIKQ